jgi:hypothetical protein
MKSQYLCDTLAVIRIVQLREFPERYLHCWDISCESRALKFSLCGGSPNDKLGR